MKSKTNSNTKNGINNKKRIGNVRRITPKTILGGVGLFAISSLGKVFGYNKNDINVHNIDECKKYRTGKNDVTKYIGITKEQSVHNGKIFRQGCQLNGKPINDDIIDHKDVCFLDADLSFYDILDPLKKHSFNANLSLDKLVRKILNQYNDRELLNYQGTEGQMRYNDKCMDKGYDYKLTVGVLKKCKFYDFNAIKCKLSDKDKQIIVDGYKNYLEKKIEKVKNDDSVKTIALKYTNDRGNNGDYAFPVYPKDLKEVFLKMMDTGKNIYIKELSCFYSKDYPDMIIELLTSRTDYNGKIILQRNKDYEEELLVAPEFKVELDKKKNLVGLKNNMAMLNSEFILFDKSQIKCITENEAREILGGSYLENIKLNKYFNVKNADKISKQCKKQIKDYERYLIKIPSKSYDDSLTKTILNEEAKNKEKNNNTNKTQDL